MKKPVKKTIENAKGRMGRIENMRKHAVNAKRQDKYTDELAKFSLDMIRRKK